jgi:sulfur oxidation c-type cytochrome SoxX
LIDYALINGFSRRGDFMKKIIFLAILGALVLQGCKTAGKMDAKPEAKAAKPVELDGFKIMESKSKGHGNCLACHAIPARPDLVAGNIGPAFIGMKARFPDFEKLKEKIADAKKFDPQTMMPPFGRNHILTPEQIDSVAKYIYQY